MVNPWWGFISRPTLFSFKPDMLRTKCRLLHRLMWTWSTPIHATCMITLMPLHLNGTCCWPRMYCWACFVVSPVWRWCYVPHPYMRSCRYAWTPCWWPHISCLGWLWSPQEDDVCAAPIYVFVPVCMTTLLETTHTLFGLTVVDPGRCRLFHSHICVRAGMHSAGCYRPHIYCRACFVVGPGWRCLFFRAWFHQQVFLLDIHCCWTRAVRMSLHIHVLTFYYVTGLMMSHTNRVPCVHVILLYGTRCCCITHFGIW